jgi:hypothetical protein
MSKNERKLDLFNALNRLSRKERDYYNTLSEAEKKEFLPLIIMRWMSGTKDANQVYLLNEVVNPFVFGLHKHKELLADLLTISASGRGQRYTWMKAKNKAISKAPIATSVIQEMYSYTMVQANEALQILSDEAIIEYAEKLGRQSDEISKLKKELKALRG